MRAHLCGVPFGEPRVVHGEAVAVLGYGNYVLCASAGKEVDPVVGVEFLGAEHGDEVFVAEL